MNTYRCYFDGSCTPINPNGKMGIGVHIISEGHEYKEAKTYQAKIGNTCNIAEYLALVRILKLMKTKKNCVIEIFGDSALVINQMTGNWQIKEGQYKPYANQAKELLAELKKKNDVRFGWIPRERNQMADQLSKSENKVEIL